MKKYYCDRCKREVNELKRIDLDDFSRRNPHAELCESCVTSFVKWLTTGVSGMEE